MMASTIGLNSTQLKEHYAMCIQLCSTNKINTKNAFGLHIIDYMDQLTKNQKDGNLNFKLVSSTLDVGTKIYSNRVDSVNTQAQKVASNLHHALDDKKSGDLDDDQEGEETDEQQVKKKARRPVKKNKTIGSKESVTLTQLEYTGEQDQLFLKLSSTVDVGAANSFLIETLDIDSTYTYRIDSNEPYYTTETKQEPDNEQRSTNTEFNDFFDKFSELTRNENLRICPRLDSFSFNNLTDGFDYGQNSAYAFRNLSTLNEENLLNEDLADINENLNDLDDADFGGNLDCSDNNEYGMQNDYSLAHKSMINNDNVQFMLGIIGALSDNPTDYCLFDKKITLAWAGHEFWKPNPIYRIKMNQIAQQKNQQGEKIKRVGKVFAEINFDNIQEEQIAEKSNEIKLRTTTLQNWRLNKRIQLPEDFKREPADFVTRFTKDPYNVHRRYQKENLENSYMDNTMFDNNDPNSDDQDDENNSDIAGTEFNYDDFDYATQETDQHTGPMPFIGDNLVDQPQIIPTINLPYTKFAKKIDVKRLKCAIWDLIKTNDDEHTQFNESKKSILASTIDKMDRMEVSDDDDEENDDSTTDEETAEDEKYIRFSTIYQQLPKKVNPMLAKNLSAPITLVTLLHVVNEKNLKIEGMEDLSDFSVIASEQLIN